VDSLADQRAEFKASQDISIFEKEEIRKGLGKLERVAQEQDEAAEQREAGKVKRAKQRTEKTGRKGC
jgi:hypothetical protein